MQRQGIRLRDHRHLSITCPAANDSTHHGRFAAPTQASLKSGTRLSCFFLNRGRGTSVKPLAVLPVGQRLCCNKIRSPQTLARQAWLVEPLGTGCGLLCVLPAPPQSLATVAVHRNALSLSRVFCAPPETRVRPSQHSMLPDLSWPQTGTRWSHLPALHEEQEVLRAVGLQV